ncbi:MAG: hypothetical protein L0Z68_03840 [Gammaproteobacteria bacterium]|nr:hypothetical protein [Gammaproteobacteria bacterium]
MYKSSWFYYGLLSLLLVAAPQVGAYDGETTPSTPRDNSGGDFSDLTLKGIDAVTLQFNWTYYGSLSGDSKRYGLDQADLEKAITERLQQAGLGVLNYDEALKSPHAVLMQIDIGISSGSYRWYSYAVGVKVANKLPLSNTQGAFTPTTIWSDGRVGPVEQIELRRLGNYILGMVDHFIQDYRAQNQV